MHFHARKKRLVKSRMQIRLTMAFLTLSLLGAVFQAFLLQRSLAAEASKLAAGGDDLLRELPTVLSVNLLLTSVVLVPVTIAFGILVTHRVAGPAVRMEEHLRAWIAGHDEGPCQLRRGDDLHELRDLLNEALAVAGDEAGREVADARDAA